MNFESISIVQLVEEIKSGRVSATDVSRFCLERASQTQSLNAFTALDEEYVLQQAKAIDKKVAQGKPLGRLAGIPVGVKDNMTTEFYPTACASECFKNTDLLPKTDSQVVANLRSQDAIIFGKTNMDELAMGFSSTNSAFGEVSNPFNPQYSAGGSSGGSAVAVAVGSVFCALGSDTGGSIRQPASNCGVVGFKPTFNSVSRNGVFPLSNSLDHVGCMARSVRDCAETFLSIQKKPRNYTDCFADTPISFKVSCLTDFEGATVDEDVLKVYFDAITAIKDVGYKPNGLKFGFSRRVAETYKVLCSTEGIASFENFNKTHPNAITMQKCGREVNNRVAFGKSVLATDPQALDRAFIEREKTRQYVSELFDVADIIVCPTTLMRTLKKHEEISNEKGFTSDLFSIVCNLTGIPAITIPMGRDCNGIPVGLQIMAIHNREEDLFAFAYSVEKALKNVK